MCFQAVLYTNECWWDELVLLRDQDGADWLKGMCVIMWNGFELDNMFNEFKKKKKNKMNELGDFTELNGV